MGAEAILEKIRQNAEEEAAALRRQGEERAAAAAEKIRAEAAADAEALLESARRSAEELSRREDLMTGLEARKNALAARRDVVDEAFSEAHRMLLALPAERWEALISRLVLEASETGEEVLEVPASDREKYENGLLERLNAAQERSRRKGKLTMAGAPGKMEGGFRLVGPVYDVDCSFEMLLSLVREENEREIARLLYPETRAAGE